MKIIEHYFRYIIGHSQFELEHVWSLDAVKLITCKEQYLMDDYLDWATNQSAKIKKKPNPQGYACLQFKNPVCSAKTLEKDFRLLNWILAMNQTDFVRVDLTLCTSPRFSDLWKICSPISHARVLFGSSPKWVVTVVMVDSKGHSSELFDFSKSLINF